MTLSPSIAVLETNQRLHYLTRVQGTDDNVIGIEHGRKLHALCKNAAQPFWGLGRNHDNLELDPEYLPALKKFLKECFGPDYRG